MITQHPTLFEYFVTALQENDPQPAAFALEKFGSLSVTNDDYREEIVLEADGGYYIAVKNLSLREGTTYQLNGSTYELLECFQQNSGVVIWFADRVIEEAVCE